jgi:hypothetical protein
MCLRFKFGTHQRVCVLNFLKKSQIRCTLFYIVLVHNQYCTVYELKYRFIQLLEQQTEQCVKPQLQRESKVRV